MDTLVIQALSPWFDRNTSVLVIGRACDLAGVLEVPSEVGAFRSFVGGALREAVGAHFDEAGTDEILSSVSSRLERQCDRAPQSGMRARSTAERIVVVSTRMSLVDDGPLEVEIARDVDELLAFVARDTRPVIVAYDAEWPSIDPGTFVRVAQRFGPRVRVMARNASKQRTATLAALGNVVFYRGRSLGTSMLLSVRTSCVARRLREALADAAA